MSTPVPYVARPPAKVQASGLRRLLRLSVLEDAFFVAATGFSIYFAIVVLRQPGPFWLHVLTGIVFWAVIAYLAMPRINTILTSIYVPDYFMGRTRAAGGVLGDPVNLALQGTADQVHAAMHRAGWTLADPVTLRSSWGIIVSAVARRSYPTAPVSPLFLFGRMQDFAYQQEVHGNASRRHHVRFFRTPPGWVLPGGHRVDWLASGSYDRSVGLSLFTFQVTHKIDADIDVERDHIVSCVTTAMPGVTVDLIRDFSTGYHSRNGGGDLIHTDGDLPILRLEGVDAPPRHVLTTPPRTRDVGARPVPVVQAMVLSLASIALSTVLGLRDILLGRDYTSLPTGGRLSAHQVTVLGVGEILAVCAAMVLLAFMTYQGRAWARVSLLGLTALALASHVGVGRPDMLTLVSMAIDLGIMYSLTSPAARQWTGPPSLAGVRSGLPRAGAAG